MLAMNRLTASTRIFALWLALLGVTLRALIPAGYMPAMSRADGAAIVLCTSQGAVVVLSEPGKPLKPATGHGEDCPFGFALSMAAAPATLAHVDLGRELPPSSHTSRAKEILASPRDNYSSRAPPLFS